MIKSNGNTIDLEDFRAPEAKVFTGRDRGLKVRNDSKIDQIENQYDTVQIIIPEVVYSINPSFFEELFYNVVSKLGRDKFLKKFQFHHSGNYNYLKPLHEAIERILRNNTALG